MPSRSLLMVPSSAAPCESSSNTSAAPWAAPGRCASAARAVSRRASLRQWPGRGWEGLKVPSPAGRLSLGRQTVNWQAGRLSRSWRLLPTLTAGLAPRRPTAAPRPAAGLAPPLRPPAAPQRHQRLLLPAARLLRLLLAMNLPRPPRRAGKKGPWRPCSQKAAGGGGGSGGGSGRQRRRWRSAAAAVHVLAADRRCSARRVVRSTLG